MKLDCKFCVICLKELSQLKMQVKRGRKRKDEVFKRRKSASSIKLLLTYLLSSRSSTYATVLKDILELSGVEIDEREAGEGLNVSRCANYFRLCENCEGVAGRILERQLELEKLQMRIVHDVKSVKETILRSSGWLGGIVGENGEEAFEHFSSKFCDADFSSNAKRIFDILKDFQAAVSESGKTSILVPLVYLEQYSAPQLSSQTLLFSAGCTDSADIVKIEPQPMISQYDNTGSYHQEIFPLLDDSNSDVGMSVQMDVDQLDKNIFLEDDNAPVTDSIISPSPNYQSVKKSRKPKPSTKFKKRDKGLVQKRRRRAKNPNLPIVRRVLDQFECDTCNFKTRYPPRFEQHLRGHETEEKVFHCDDCSTGFTTKQHFTFHQGQHHGYHKLICDICRNFFNVFELEAHMKTHVESDKICRCSYCSQCFASMDRLILHFIRNHQVEGIKMSCEICGNYFHTKQDMLEHLHGAHKEIKKIKCEFEGCDETFFQPSVWRRHRNYHTGKYTCAKCLKKFYTQADHDVHQKVHDTEKQELFQCDQCPDTFQSSRRLRGHKMKEHGAAKFSCDICGREYISTEGLRFHKKRDHEGTGGKRCPICNKKLPSAYRLRMHTETKHSVSKNYVCEECGKAFRTLNDCRIHGLIHGEKKHQCPHCAMVFFRKNNLARHIRTHTGEKPYICECCGKDFTRLETMKTHRQKCSINLSSGRGNEADSYPTDFLA